MPEVLAVAGVILAIPGIIDLSIKYGEFLCRLVNDARHSTTEQYARARNLEKQINDIRVEFRLLERKPRSFQDYFKYEAEQLYILLDYLYRKLLVLGTISSAAWALFSKKDVDGCITKIENFHGQFAMKFMLFTFGAMDVSAVGPDATDSTSPSSRFVNDMRRSIKNRKEGFYSGAVSLRKEFGQLPSTTNAISGTELGFLRTKEYGFMVVEERGYSTKAELAESEKRILDVASVLCTRSEEDKALLAGMGIPHCIGFASEPLNQAKPEQPARLRLIYHTPYETPKLRSLRKILLSAPEFALNDRIYLANTLAKAVYFTHISQFVHKDIRPGNILICDPDTDEKYSRYPHALGSAFLVGFSDSRRSAAASQVVGTKATERDLYQHPARLEGQPIKHTFMHDVFSLGVCLLEIGLWQSVVVPSGQESEPWKINTEWKFLSKEGPERRHGYIRVAERQVSRIMGRKYSEIVINCLRHKGVDSVIQSSKDVATDVAMGMWYVEQVIAKLDNINI